VKTLREVATPVAFAVFLVVAGCNGGTDTGTGGARDDGVQDSQSTSPTQTSLQTGNTSTTSGNSTDDSGLPGGSDNGNAGHSGPETPGEGTP
jgi:hypothetical protein